MIRISASKRLALSFLVGAALLNIPQVIQAECPISFPPGGGPASVTLTGTWAYEAYPQSAPAYFTDQVTGSAEVPAGTYFGWCIDDPDVIGAGPTTYPTLLFASCDTNLNAQLEALGYNFPGSVYVGPEVWSQINYILNNPGGATFYTIQVAIWNLIGGPIDPAQLVSPPYPPWSQTEVSALLAAAAQNTSYEPPCGGVIAVVVAAITGNDAHPIQLTIIEVPVTCPCPCEPKAITYNFNGTQIIFKSTPGGSYVWFISDGTVKGLPSSPVTLHISDQTITIPATGSSPQYTVPVPDSWVTLSPSIKVATETFTSGAWQIDLPSSGLAGNVFYGGAAFKVPVAGLPGGIKNVLWSGKFTTATPGLSINWQWHAAAYSEFTSDYTLINPKPVDDNKASIYQTSDQSGTPEGTDPSTMKQWKNFVEGGASGGGGGNYTGSGSSTIQFPPCVCPNP
jgi:hypothetical protein